MREELKKKLGSRLRFKGTFKRYGLKNAYKGLRLETVCLRDVKTMQGEEVTDHLWFNHTKGFKALGLLYPGDIIAFDARVESYLKRGPREEYEEEYYKVVDYHLTRPTKLKVLAKGAPRNIYNVCEKCGHPNGLSKKWCRRCGVLLEEQEEQPEVEAPEPRVEQVTLEEATAEFNSIMKLIGVKTK